VLERAERSLAALLADAPRPGAGPGLLLQICEGLAQLHGAGWVHGDLKPANVLLMADGSVRLAAFNTAAELDGTHAYTPAFATPDYTPPELLWSRIDERGRRIRPSADIWAFGVIAHLVLTGSFPLPGATPAPRRDAATAYARGSDARRPSAEIPDAGRGTGRAGPARGPRLPRPRRTARPRPARRRTRRAVTAAAALATATVVALGYGLGVRAGDPPGADGRATAGGTGVAAATYGADELRTDRGV